MCGPAYPVNKDDLISNLNKARASSDYNKLLPNGQTYGANAEAYAKAQLGDEYIAPGQTSKLLAPDLTDDLVRKKKAAAAYAALSGQGRASTMTGSSTTITAGAGDLGKTFLGGL